MSIQKYPHLFQPLKIRGTVFRNRMFAAPQGFYFSAPGNYPNADCAAYWEIKARGGFACVCIGECVVDSETGVHYDVVFHIDDENMMAGFAAVAGAITRHGCVASAELAHAGMAVRRNNAPGIPKYGPVAFKDEQGEVEEMPEEVIYRIIDAFGRGADYAKRAGFGMVTVHAGHGWLLTQFMSSKINTRKDKWGGSFENRMRMPLAVLESIRRHVGPNFPVEMRISGDEVNPGGYDINEGIEIAKALDGHTDIIHVSAGCHENHDAFVVTHPSMFLEDGVNSKYAAEIKKHVKTSYISTVGSFSNPAHMEEVLASGGADIIHMARQSLADPYLPFKARTGRDDEIQECIRCMGCYLTGSSIRIHYCSINPVTSREREVLMAPAPRSKKKVLVAGGGVAGMQAALTAADRGHSVILCEKSSRLGGVLLCEEKVPFKKHMADYLARQALLISRAAIDVRLNTEVTPDLARTIKPDVIIAALGTRPVKPPIPGIEGSAVLSAQDAYANPDKCGQKTVILGGGYVGLELAVYLAQLGREAVVLEVLDNLNLGRSLHGRALMIQIRNFGIDVRLSTRVTGITNSGVSGTGPDGGFELPADSVVYATGQEPLVDEALAMFDCADEFHQIGDCLAPKNIMKATHTAFVTAYDIGVI